MGETNQDFNRAKLFKEQIKNFIVVLKIYQIYIDEQIENNREFYGEVDIYICRTLIKKLEETIIHRCDEGIYYYVPLSEDETDAIDMATEIAHKAVYLTEFETKIRELIVEGNLCNDD